VLLFGAPIAAILIGDSLRFGRPTRAFLLALAACLAAVGTASAVFAIGLQFDPAHARQLGTLAVAGPCLTLACGFGARLCLKKAFPDDSGR
jgi:H+/Cl- antiporter ClcA